MRIAIIVLAHRNAAQLASLLASLRHPEIRLYLHLDARVNVAPFRDALRHLPDVALLPRFRSRWGGIEVVDATLAGLELALSDGCEYFLLISGQDFPLWPAERIVSFYAKAPDRSYIESFALPDARWAYGGKLRTEFYTYTFMGRRETCIPASVPASPSWKGWLLNGILRMRGLGRPPRHFPEYARPFGGAQWWNLSQSAARFVLAFLRDHPDYRTYHEHTLLPDEIFFQSLLLGADFASGHEVVNDALRFMVWPAGSSHPRTLGMADIPEMKASGKPFARKFDTSVDGVAVAYLAEHLRRANAAGISGEACGEDQPPTLYP